MGVEFRSTLLVAFLLVTLWSCTAHAQTDAGAVDGAFNPAANDSVASIAVQPDGKIIVGGNFTRIDGMPRSYIARLNVDGTVDGGFQASIDGTVSLVALQADGKIILAGTFGQINGTAAKSLGRLNPDGTPDTEFHASASVTDLSINTVIVQPDNKILIGGGKTNQPFPTVTRLNSNGTVDLAFSATLSGYDSRSNYLSAVRTLALQSDGKVIVGGIFNQVSGTERNGLARLNADGTLDGSFDPGGILASIMSEVNSPLITCAQMQGDGRVIVGGFFATNNNGVIKDCVARLNADGKLDTSFGATTDNTVYGVTVQSDGKVLVNGPFSKVNGVSHLGLMRLNEDGGLDTGFDPGTGPAVSAPNHTSGVGTLAVQADGKIVIGGRFDSFGGTQRVNTARLLGATAHSPFFDGEVALGGEFYYLALPNGTPFGYYAYFSDARFIYHFDLGYEYWTNANDGKGIYFYDFKSGGFFYTSPALSFPYLYDFSLKTFLYYYPDPTNPQHYNTNGVRFFYRFDTGQIIVK